MYLLNFILLYISIFINDLLSNCCLLFTILISSYFLCSSDFISIFYYCRCFWRNRFSKASEVWMIESKISKISKIMKSIALLFCSIIFIIFLFIEEEIITKKIGLVIHKTFEWIFTTKEIFENVFGIWEWKGLIEIIKFIPKTFRIYSSILIIHILFFRVWQYRICLTYLFKFSFSLFFISWIFVWMPFKSKLSICFFNLFFSGISR